MFLSAEADIGPFFSLPQLAKLVEGLYTGFKKAQANQLKSLCSNHKNGSICFEVPLLLRNR